MKWFKYIICMCSLLAGIVFFVGCDSSEGWEDDVYFKGSVYSWNGTDYLPVVTGNITQLDHAASHVDGTDDIQNATSGQKGLSTAAQVTKLDGIEALADVTDAVNVDSSGAVMVTDFNAKGDILSASADDTPLILNVGSDNQVLSANSSTSTGLGWVDVASGGSGKNGFIWVNAVAAYGGGVFGVYGISGSYYPGVNLNSTDYGYAQFYIPSDFVSIVSAKVVVMCRDTESTNNYWDVVAVYCSPGDEEIHNTHVESEDELSWYWQAVTTGHMYEAEINMVLTNIEPGDIVVIRMGPASSSDEFQFLGVAFEYN